MLSLDMWNDIVLSNLIWRREGESTPTIIWGVRVKMQGKDGIVSPAITSGPAYIIRQAYDVAPPAGSTRICLKGCI